MTTIDRRYSVAEGTAVKAPCRVATTANVTLSGLQTIDGVTLVDRDRVLVRNQSTASENGIYEASSGNWQRTKDFDGAYDIVQGTRVYVTSGTTYAGREFVVTASDTITIDSTSITFSGSNPTSGNVTRAFDTYADMLAASYASGDVVLLLGYYSVGDGGFGKFSWSASSSATHNGGTIVRPTAYASSNGRLLRMYDGDIMNIRWFGARDDGTDTSDTIIESAISTANAANAWLDWSNIQMTCAAAISVDLSSSSYPIKWKSDGASITYSGAGAINHGLEVYINDGLDHLIVGSGLTYDGNYKVSVGHRYIQLAATADTTFYAEKLKGTRCNDPSGGVITACGVQVRGGYRLVRLIDPIATHIRRETGSTIGTVGVCIINDTTNGAYCLNSEIVRPYVTHMTSSDASETTDMDAIGVFAHPDTYNGLGYARTRIVDPHVQNSWSRHVKTQVAHCDIEGGFALLNAAPSGGRAFPVYTNQTGSLNVTGGQIDVYVTHGAALVNFNTGTNASPMVGTWKNTAVHIDGGASVTSGVYCDVATNGYVSVSCENILFRGSGNVREFFWLAADGNENNVVNCKNVLTRVLTDSFFKITAGDGTSPYRGKLRMESCINAGTVRPAFIDRLSGTSATHNLFMQDCVGFTSVGIVNVGWDLEDGENRSLATVGSSGSCVIKIKPRYNSRESHAILHIDNSAIKSLQVGSDWNIGTTTDPGSGTFRAWLAGSGTATPQLTVQNNSGATREFIVELVG